MKSLLTFNRAIQLGIGTGIRSMTPLAAFSWAAESGRMDLPAGMPVGVLENRWTSRALLLAAAGEMVADKVLPLPARTGPIPLGSRVAIGAFLGWALFATEGEMPAVGAVTGGIAAAWGAFAASGARQFLTKTGLPDPVAGTLEDVAAVGLAFGGVSKTRSTIR